MRIAIALFVVCWASQSLSFNTNQLKIQSAILNGAAVPFLEHSDPGPFGSYLAMNLPAAPAGRLVNEVSQWAQESLTTRGEAHITVITPVEFQKLKAVVSIDEINQIAKESDIQRTPFEIKCLGRGIIQEQNRRLSTYFIVVDAPGLFDIRTKIGSLFLGRGGSIRDFNPNVYYPHITIGYTDRDLHLEDGIIKDERLCTADLLVVP